MRWLMIVLLMLAPAAARAASARHAKPPPSGFHHQPAAAPDATAARLLAAHNTERARLALPPLAWDAALARAAGQWAAELARSGRFEHASDDDLAEMGENLFAGTAGAFPPEAMVEDLIAERARFRPGIFPEVASAGTWHDVGHYTQIVWRRTRAVGCAVARGGGMDVLVCRYWPAGNVVGEPVY